MSGAHDRILHRQRVDDRRQHAHLIRLYGVHRIGKPAAPDIAAAHHDAHLNAQIREAANRVRRAIHARRIEGRRGRAALLGQLFGRQRFAAELQNYTLIHEGHSLIHTILLVKAAGANLFVGADLIRKVHYLSFRQNLPF